jgi:hypothetical protein
MNGQTDFTVKAEPEDFKNTLFLAMELSRATWLVATFAPRLGDKISVHAIPGGDTKRCLSLSAKGSFEARTSAGCGRCAAMKQATTDFGCTGCSSTTASRTTSSTASLPIDRRAKHIKTDNIDAKRLLRADCRLRASDPQSCRVVRAPTPEEEDARRLHRERQRLVRERTGHLNRIKALLITHGIRALRKHQARPGVNKAGNTGARDRRANGVVVAEVSIEKRATTLVLQPRRGPQGSGPTHHDHRARAQAGDRSLAICRDRQGADRRNRHCLTS